MCSVCCFCLVYLVLQAGDLILFLSPMQTSCHKHQAISFIPKSFSQQNNHHRSLVTLLLTSPFGVFLGLSVSLHFEPSLESF